MSITICEGARSGLKHMFLLPSTSHSGINIYFNMRGEAGHASRT